MGLEGDIAVYNPRDGKRRTYKYDRVFGEVSSQVQVYEDTSALIRSVLDGEPLVSSSLLSYQAHSFLWLESTSSQHLLSSHKPTSINHDHLPQSAVTHCKHTLLPGDGQDTCTSARKARSLQSPLNM